MLAEVGLAKWEAGVPSAHGVGLVDVVRWSRTRLVAFDLRDTLVQSPRHEKVFRALCRVGVPESLARNADRAAALALQTKFVGLPGVIDWKLVELYEAVLALAREDLILAPPDFERAFRFICDEYREKTVGLVSDAMLVSACRVLEAMGCSTAVATDGPPAREAEVLDAVFPESASHLSLFTSGLAGVNKFEPEYYKRLAEKFSIPASRIMVVGNRMDKDVIPAQAAGCQTCLLGRLPPSGYSGYWAPDISSMLSTSR